MTTHLRLFDRDQTVRWLREQRLGLRRELRRLTTTTLGDDGRRKRLKLKKQILSANRKLDALLGKTRDSR